MQPHFSLPYSFPKFYQEKYASCASENDFFQCVSENSKSLKEFFDMCEQHPPEREWYKKNNSLMGRIFYKIHENFSNAAKEALQNPEISMNVAPDYDLVAKSHSLFMDTLFQKQIL